MIDPGNGYMTLRKRDEKRIMKEESDDFHVSRLRYNSNKWT